MDPKRVKLLPIEGCDCTEVYSDYGDTSLYLAIEARQAICDGALCHTAHPICGGSIDCAHGCPGCPHSSPAVRQPKSTDCTTCECPPGFECVEVETDDDGSPIEKGKKDFEGEIDGGAYKRSFDDPSKPPLSLLPTTALWSVARVFGVGASKYARGNWMRGMSFTGVADGVLRHITAWLSGETHDPETGLNHLGHACCGLMFLLTYQEGPRKDEYARFDDRLPLTE